MPFISSYVQISVITITGTTNVNAANKYNKPSLLFKFSFASDCDKGSLISNISTSNNIIYVMICGKTFVNYPPPIRVELLLQLYLFIGNII